MTASVTEFPQNGYFLIADSTTLNLGGYELAETGDLKLGHLRVYNFKAPPFSYTMTLKVSTSVGGPALATSTAETFSDTAIGQMTSHFLTDLTFEFDGSYTLLAGEVYYFRLEITGYTRPARPNENTSYLGVWCDWLGFVGLSNTAGARIAIGVMQ